MIKMETDKIMDETNSNAQAVSKSLIYFLQVYICIYVIVNMNTYVGTFKHTSCSRCRICMHIHIHTISVQVFVFYFCIHTHIAIYMYFALVHSIKISVSFSSFMLNLKHFAVTHTFFVSIKY